MQNSSYLLERKLTIENALVQKSTLFNLMSEEEKIQAKKDVMNLEQMRKEVEKELEQHRAAARGLAAPPLTAPQEGGNVGSEAPLQPARQQSVTLPSSQSTPTEETATRRPATRSSSQSGSQNTSGRSVPAKRRKTGEMFTVLPQEAPLAVNEDSEMVTDNQKQVSISGSDTEKRAEVSLRQVTTASRAKVETSELPYVSTHTHGDVVACRRGEVVLNSACHVIGRLMKNSFSMLLLLMTLSCLIRFSAAMPSNHVNGVSYYALNANGMVNQGKLSQISDAVRIRRPHILTISETKTSDKVGNKLQTDEYNFFEETGIKMENHHLYKWGVVVGVRKDIQVAQRVQLNKTLEGRVVALDLVIGTNAGRGFIHRFVGVYAPWNPGPDNNEAGFWNEVAKVCNEAALMRS
jgi:hypothetical protein